MLLHSRPWARAVRRASGAASGPCAGALPVAARQAWCLRPAAPVRPALPKRTILPLCRAITAREKHQACQLPLACAEGLASPPNVTRKSRPRQDQAQNRRRPPKRWSAQGVTRCKQVPGRGESSPANATASEHEKKRLAKSAVASVAALTLSRKDSPSGLALFPVLSRTTRRAACSKAVPAAAPSAASARNAPRATG